MTKAQRGRPGPRRTLTEDAIVEAALRLLDRGGADAVSMRAIAAETGCAPNALYTYFPDKAAVLRAMADRLLGEYDLDALTDPAVPWRQRLHDLALRLRSRLLAHPGATAVLLGAPMDGPRALALGEALLGLLAEGGLGERDAARASYVLIVHVLGSVALEAAELDPTRPLPPIHLSRSPPKGLPTHPGCPPRT
ncbi:TetR/AcrR family transcriptional regulator [Streptomyces specialis]|uniref:TetR/AcrR family transcriptional regulator n=1 Tax=Streptomyces specialis TaxID=498367 RepID=UPI00073F415D|nr:TetR/AcrR family transcriptional regulator [Streptomyces specialis]